ncbi:hypothetical protein MM221_03860 [Salipaludibacillus sp. LMS25]|uniref:hypothetical protein n=1 Tax=Salipaludibacillus sp. LMS25 TaxID=2924031 RepID=UPI0020D1F4B7|nr:hypothetical protein [Salipaludibacillus sp. LMS25]UTR15732.1 hypothetical protein MM221_03860 [Salipaludibacillus sp. LMS25]
MNEPKNVINHLTNLQRHRNIGPYARYGSKLKEEEAAFTFSLLQASGCPAK